MSNPSPVSPQPDVAESQSPSSSDRPPFPRIALGEAERPYAVRARSTMERWVSDKFDRYAHIAPKLEDGIAERFERRMRATYVLMELACVHLSRRLVNAEQRLLFECARVEYGRRETFLVDDVAERMTLRAMARRQMEQYEREGRVTLVGDEPMLKVM